VYETRAAFKGVYGFKPPPPRNSGKKFSAGITPGLHDKGEGRERRGGEGEEGKEGRGGEQREGWDGVNPPKTNPGYAALYETYNAVLVLHSRIF
jgi:hypothetical protein